MENTTPNAGSATGIDLAELPRYTTNPHDKPREYGDMVERPDGEYVLLADVEALARATPHYTELADAYAKGCADARALDAATPQHPRPTDDHLWDETLRDRDANAEWADKLAGAIAIHFGVDIGEHSNMNCPWVEALEAIESAPPPGDNTLLASAYASFSAAVEKHIPRTADAATPQHSVTEQAKEAKRLAPILRGMCEGGGPGDDIDIYADDYQAADGDVFVVRAAELLEEFAARAQPLASTAATQPEQASIKPWRMRRDEWVASPTNHGVVPIEKMMEAEIADLRTALTIPASTAASEQHPDDAAVDRFAAAMKAKMAASRAKGRGGWNDPAACPTERLQLMLRDHVAKGDPVDVGNFAMMLWNRGEKTCEQGVPPSAEYVVEARKLARERAAASEQQAHTGGKNV